MQRRAYFLLENLSMSDSAISIAESHRNTGALWDLLVLRVKRPVGQDAADAMSDILNRYGDYDDETIIQLVTTFSELGLLDWLKEHKILYSNAVCIRIHSCMSSLRRWKNRETITLPLNCSMSLPEWSRSTLHTGTCSHRNILMSMIMRNALGSIEYAVALNPDSASILTTKAQILFDMKKDTQEAYRMMREVVAQDNEYTPSLLLFLLCLQ